MNVNMYSLNTIDFYTAANKISSQQDTIKQKTNLSLVLGSDSLEQNENSVQDTLRHQTIQRIDFSAIDSILQKSEEREIQEQIQVQLQQQAAYQRWINRQVDTSEILYKEFGIAGFPIKEKLDNELSKQNFLYNFLSVKPEEKQESNIVFVERQTKTNTNYSTQPDKLKIIPKDIQGRIQFDWITILLIASVLLLGWVQLLN
jgi:hypothetical protein